MQTFSGSQPSLLQLAQDWLRYSRLVRIHILDANKLKIPYQSTIRRLIYRAYHFSRQALPIGAIDVVVQVQTELTLPEIGIGGYSPSAYLSFIFINPSNSQLENTLLQHLPAIVSHEFMHCARWLGPGYGTTLGEALVSEGLALQFEATLRGEAPWYAQTLNTEALAQSEQEARADWQRSDYDRMSWFSPFSTNGNPPYRGYSLGYHLVARGMLTTGLSASQMWDRPAMDF